MRLRRGDHGSAGPGSLAGAGGSTGGAGSLIFLTNPVPAGVVVVSDPFTMSASLTNPTLAAVIDVEAPAAWTPLDMAACTLWLDPAEAVQTGVLTWTDLSPTGAVFVSGAATKTTNINSVDTITGNGTTALFDTTKVASDFITAAAWMVAFVWQDNGSPATTATFYGDGSIIGDCQTGLGGYWNVGVNSTGAIFGQWDGAEKHETMALAAGAHYAIVWYDGTKLYYQLDGGSVSAGVAAGSITDITHTVRMFQTAYGAVYAKGDMGDVIVCNAAPSSGDRSDINTFLSTKYGL